MKRRDSFSDKTIEDSSNSFSSDSSCSTCESSASDSSNGSSKIERSSLTLPSWISYPKWETMPLSHVLPMECQEPNSFNPPYPAKDSDSEIKDDLDDTMSFQHAYHEFCFPIISRELLMRSEMEDSGYHQPCFIPMVRKSKNFHAWRSDDSYDSESDVTVDLTTNDGVDDVFVFETNIDSSKEIIEGLSSLHLKQSTSQLRGKSLDEMWLDPEQMISFSSFKPESTSTPSSSFNETCTKEQKVKPINVKKRKRDEQMSDKENLQEQKKIKEEIPHCEYCKERGVSSLIYNFHTLKDKKGRTLCPVLRQLECPICGVDGDEAHQVGDCPMKSNKKQPRGILKATASKSINRNRTLRFLNI